MSDFVISLIRTFVPTAVGAAIAWLVSLGVDIDLQTQQALAGALVTVCVTGYYALARFAEERWPQLGWLLGVAKQPVYNEELEPFDEDYKGE